MTCSPRPEYHVEVADMGRGFRLYLFDRLDGWPTVRGGPYASEQTAQRELARRERELDELYDAVEERARRDGVVVCWSG